MNNHGNIRKLIDLRHHLHREPEVSGNEEQTAKTLLQFLKQQHPDLLVTAVGGHGIIAVYNGEIFGRTILLRCDMDALPINESTEVKYRSAASGISHKCGHDGHMAIMCGVAVELAENRPDRGTVILLFQPAEETGQGAARVISRLDYMPDFCYALHNLPGFPLGDIITRNGPFAGASRGMIIELKGQSSHAAQPLEGISPAPAVASLISYFGEVSKHSEGIIATLIHASIGEVSFGTSPGDATVMVTLRAPTAEEMDNLSQDVTRQINRTCEEEKLQCKISWTEEFPATANAELPNSVILQTAEYLGYKTTNLEKTFHWSEDFGHFTEKYPGALFGLGSGLNTPPLHNPEFDFPDQLIPIGIAMFKGIIERSLKL